MAASNIGMMDGAYFVGRTELLRWINSTLAINLQKIEECAPGHVACQLMDVLHPGMVPLNKVNFAAKNEYEYINNYKVLQTVFDKFEVAKHIEVSKLVKGRALDNLEFMQWMKAYYDSTLGSGRRQEAYDPELRRQQSGVKVKLGGPPSRAARPTSARPVSATGSRATSASTTRTPSTRPAVASPPTSPASSSTAKVQVESLNAELTQLKLSMDGIEKERDFYFSKLRDVEILCQMAEFKDLPVVQAVVSILYASDENVDVLQIAQTAIEQSASKPGDENDEFHDANLAE